MIVENVRDIDKFFGVIDKCEGRVELVTNEGDRLNLKSTLTKYIALAKVFSDGKISRYPCRHTVCRNISHTCTECAEHHKNTVKYNARYFFRDYYIFKYVCK